MAAEVAASDVDGASIGSIEEGTAAVARLRAEVAKLIVGQDEVVDDVLMTILAGGHGLLIGAPGLAKTLLVRSVAEAMHLDFRRIQFTPDLVPSDITGTELLDEDQDTGQKSFRFVRGPVFANIILADEINRAPPRTQAAMLEAMQERTVTAAGRTMPLPQPFFVLATQNPIEQEGTYPLPEAQLDRFLFALNVDYPTLDEEMSILESTTGRAVGEIEPVLRGEDVILLQGMVRDVAVAEAMLRYVADLVRATRPGSDDLPERVGKYVRWGAGPRAGQALILGAKVRALLEGRSAITPADVRRIAHPVLRHRVLVNFAAEADGVTAEDVIDDILEHVPAPKSNIRI